MSFITSLLLDEATPEAGEVVAAAPVAVTIKLGGPSRPGLRFWLTMDAPATIVVNGQIESAREWEAVTNSENEATFEGVYPSSVLRLAKRFDTYTLSEQTTATKLRVRVPDEGGNVAAMIVS